MDIFAVNWLAVVLAALAGFVVGGIWYGPLLGKRWMAAIGMTEDDMENVHKSDGLVKIYGSTFLLSLVASWTLAHVFATYPDLAFNIMVLTAFGVALGFVVPALWTNYLFQGSNRSLFLIDGGYWLLFYTAMGLVHAAFA
ncbi:MAG: DUF1761 domain-containing protein [Sphingomonadaceae bacterium]|nr:DUF1761 domain-containing protein [Sphingomonadaceae bacterium]